jgi:hypothetical protein
MDLVARALTEFFSLTVGVLPYFLLGAAAGAGLQTVGSGWAERLFGRERRMSLPAAVAAGALLPGCSCATIPMAAGMQRSGGPRRGVLGAFIFVSPLLSPITVALTWSMLGWRMTVGRVVASLVGAFVFGLILNRFESWFDEPDRPGTSEEPLPIAGGAVDTCSEVCEPEGTLARRTWTSFVGILRSVTPYFLIGMAAATLITVFVPEGAVPRLLGGSAGPAAFLLAAVIGIPLYVCEGEEVPITFALLRAGLAQGPAFTFLIGSVGTCVPTILMSRRIVGDRATIFYAAWWIAFAIGSGVLFRLLS